MRARKTANSLLSILGKPKAKEVMRGVNSGSCKAIAQARTPALGGRMASAIGVWRCLVGKRVLASALEDLAGAGDGMVEPLHKYLPLFKKISLFE